MMMTGTKCELCETAEAEVLKFEEDSEFDEECNEVLVKIERPICRACAEYWYDGSETYPGTHPLA